MLACSYKTHDTINRQVGAAVAQVFTDMTTQYYKVDPPAKPTYTTAKNAKKVAVTSTCKVRAGRAGRAWLGVGACMVLLAGGVCSFRDNQTGQFLRDRACRHAQHFVWHAPAAAS
jgi:hypothetical protein